MDMRDRIQLHMLPAFVRRFLMPGLPHRKGGYLRRQHQRIALSLQVRQHALVEVRADHHVRVDDAHHLVSPHAVSIH